jgi:DNA-directed RNA polymerase specialized sigma24 family protein
LSRRARDVVRGTYFDDLDGAALARRLDTSEGNVRVLRHRALHALRDCMQREGA